MRHDEERAPEQAVRAEGLMHVCGCVLLTRWTAGSWEVVQGSVQGRHVHAGGSCSLLWPFARHHRKSHHAPHGSFKERLDKLCLSSFQIKADDDSLLVLPHLLHDPCPKVLARM